MSKFTRKIASLGVTATTVIMLSGASVLVPVAQADQLSDLLAQIVLLQAQLVALQTNQAGGAAASSYAFTRDLTVGSKGADVSALQQSLISAGHLKAVSAPTGFFGPATKAALAAWQAAKGVSPAAGYFGAKSRVAIVGSSTGGTGTVGVVPVPAGSDLVVSLASDNPAARTIGSGTAFNPALKVALTAGAKAVKVSSILLQKGGFLSNSSLNGVDVVDQNGMRYGNVQTSFNADNTLLLSFGSSPVMIGAGNAVNLTFRFNVVTGNLNGTVSLAIPSASAVSADGAVAGSFPVTGNAMQIVNGGNALASTTLDVLTSTGSSSLNVDPANLQEITKFRIQETSSNEGVKLHSLTLYNYGNAGAGDFSDVQLVDQNQNVLATSQPVGQTVMFNLATPFLIDKGLTKDFTVKAKLIGGTTKTVNLVVYNNYDVDLRGISTGVSVIAGTGTNDTAFPIGNGFNIQTIGSGTVTLNRASDSPSAAAVPGSNDVVLAKYNAKPTGESMELRQLSFYIATSTASGAKVLTGTVYVKVNGATVYSTAASNISVLAPATVTLSTYPILTAGVDNTITVVGSINTTATANDTYLVKSMNLIQTKRLVTNDLYTPTTSATDGLTIAVKAAALAVSTLATPAANSVVIGTNQYEYATIQLNAQAGGEDVRVSTVKVTSDGGNLTEVANFYVYKDSDTSPLTTTNSTNANGATITFNFGTAFTVTRTTPVTLHLKADTLSGTNAHTFYVASSTSALTAVGISTGNTLTNGSDVTFSGAGQAQTHVAAGTLTLSLVSGSGASPSANQVVSVGAAAQSVFAFKMTSQYETQKITSLKLTASTTASGGLATTTLGNIKLYEGSISASNLRATAAQFDACTAWQCTVTFTSSDNIFVAPISLTGVNMYVTADVKAGGVANLGDSFFFKIASSTGDVAVKGSVTGSTTGTRTGTPTVSGTTYVVSQRVLVAAESPTTATNVGLSSGVTVGVFKITNNGSAPIYIASTTSFTFNNGGSATNSLTFALYASTDGGGASDSSITYIATSTAAGASTTIPFDLSVQVSSANRLITGNSWRFFTIKAAANGGAQPGVPVNNNTFQFAVNALGNLVFNVLESDLGYSGNIGSGDNDLSDTITGLYVDGTPSLATVTAKS